MTTDRGPLVRLHLHARRTISAHHPARQQHRPADLVRDLPPIRLGQCRKLLVGGDLLHLTADPLCPRVGFEQAQLQPESEQVEAFGLFVVVAFGTRKPCKMGDSIDGFLGSDAPRRQPSQTDLAPSGQGASWRARNMAENGGSQWTNQASRGSFARSGSPVKILTHCVGRADSSRRASTTASTDGTPLFWARTVFHARTKPSHRSMTWARRTRNTCSSATALAAGCTLA